MITTALPRSFTLTHPVCGSRESFRGLPGFRQGKDDLNVVCGDTPLLDTNVTSKVTHSGCFVLVWRYLFHGAL